MGSPRQNYCATRSTYCLQVTVLNDRMKPQGLRHAFCSYWWLATDSIQLKVPRAARALYGSPVSAIAIRPLVRPLQPRLSAEGSSNQPWAPALLESCGRGGQGWRAEKCPETLLLGRGWHHTGKFVTTNSKIAQCLENAIGNQTLTTFTIQFDVLISLLRITYSETSECL